jgi:hypothetical protein
MGPSDNAMQQTERSLVKGWPAVPAAERAFGIYSRSATDRERSAHF